MATVAEITMTRKPSTAFYCHLYEEAGALVQVNKVIYFVGEDGQIVEFTPDMTNFCVVLGAMEMADAQRIDDLVHGGYAARACSRRS